MPFDSQKKPTNLRVEKSFRTPSLDLRFHCALPDSSWVCSNIALQTMISVRKASQEDIGPLYEIYSHSSVAPNMGFDPCSRGEFDEIYKELSSGGGLFVGEDQRGVVAVCRVVRKNRRLRHSAYIGALAVRHSAQGGGVGKEFFRSIFLRLTEDGVSRIEVLVAADNDRAIQFFREFEFEIEGTHDDYFSREGSDLLFCEHTMAYVKSRRTQTD